jgi:hypothetical protein
MTSTEARPSTVSLRFAMRWISATFIGWTTGFGLMLALIALSGLVGLGDTQFPVGLGMGAGVGFFQGRLIGQRTGRRWSWFAASAAGLASPFAVYDVAGLLDRPIPFSLAPCVVAGGLVAGLLQWWLLRGRSRHAAAWIAASIVGWSLAASTVLFNERLLPRIPGLVGALLYVIIVLSGGVLLGAVGGPVLRHILSARTE